MGDVVWQCRDWGQHWAWGGNMERGTGIWDEHIHLNTYIWCNHSLIVCCSTYKGVEGAKKQRGVLLLQSSCP